MGGKPPHPLYDEGKAKQGALGEGGELFGGGGGGGDIGNNSRKLCGFGFCSFGELGEKGVSPFP